MTDGCAHVFVGDARVCAMCYRGLADVLGGRSTPVRDLVDNAVEVWVVSARNAVGS